MRRIAWAALIAACESPPPPVPPAPPPLVRVVALEDDGSVLGPPVPEVEVLFHDSAGAVVSRMRTDAAGVAEALVEPGGAVTVLQPMSQETYARLEPPEEIIAHVFVDAARDPAFDLELRPPAPPAGTARYFYWTPCGHGRTDGTPPSITVPLRPRCLDTAGEEGALVYAEDAAGEPLAFSLVASFEPALGVSSSLALPAWSTDWRHIDVTLAGAAPDVAEVSVQLVPVVAGRSLWVPFGSPPRLPYRAGTAIALRYPAPIRTGWYIVRTWAAGGDARWSVLAREPEDVLSIDLDEMLPLLAGIELDRTSAARPCVSWRLRAPAAASDGLIGTFVWPNTPLLYWNILVPPDEHGRLCAPEMPPDVVQARLTGTASAAGVDLDLLRATYLGSTRGRRGHGAIHFFNTEAPERWRVDISSARRRVP